MRISDWSSDGCSSDLRNGTGTRQFSATLARHGILSPREVCSQNLSTYPKAIKIVGPMLHHFDALVPVTPSSICASNVIAFNMRKLALDGVRVPFSHFIEKRARSEEHTSELQSLMSISYAVFCLKKKTIKHSSLHK